MARRVWPRFLALFGVSAIAGCGFFERAERPIWRTQAEKACLAQKLVTPSDYIVPAHEIDGPGICGLTHPFKVSAISAGTVAIDKVVTVDCSMIPALEAWLEGVVQPAAQARFGEKVATLNVFGAYSCRSVDNIAGARLSEHAFGNAVDISGFTLADGRRIDIVAEWKKTDTQESAFLHDAHGGACQYFTTVLGPGADVFHYNHFHVDLANHGATNTGPRRYCRPNPAPSLLPAPTRPDGLPPAPELEEPMDVAHAAPIGSAAPGPLALHGPTGALPPPVQITGQSEPLPPTLPVDAGPGVDPQPTSSIGPNDD